MVFVFSGGDFKELSFIVPVAGSNNTFAVGTGAVIGLYVWDGSSNVPITTDKTIPLGDQGDYIYIGKTDLKGRLWAGK